MTFLARPADTALLRQIQRIVTNAFIIVGTVAVFAYVLLPFYWMLKSSLQTDLEIMKIPSVWFPTQLSFRSYARAMTIIPFARYITNSLFVSGVTTAVCTILASMAGYVLARHKFPGATVLLMLFLFTQLIPSITRVFPVYFMLQRLHLLNSYLGLTIAYVSFSLPYSVLMLQGYFRGSYPHELEEAALLDGCTWFSAFMRIVLPISIPGIIAVATYSFLGAWNDFLWASLLLNKGEMKTIQVGLRDFVGEFGVQGMNNFMAACAMTTIPAILLYGLGQKYIVQGMSAGAIKG
jgi:multiple sugar transport system permease protein